MEVLRNTRLLQARADAVRAEGRRIGLVPTMGALHEGHLALVDAARERADFVVVSIYVNPTQFNADADLEAYPRSVDADLAACEARGVDCVFLPGDDQLYPAGAETWVDLTEITLPLEGASRPGHFRGVATVVTKLLVAAKPHVACFGEKDYQQLATIRRMARDLGFDVEILGVPTERERDGLALSSRNVHLNAETRPQAVTISRALDAAAAAFGAGERRCDALVHVARVELDKAPLGRIDYLELRDPDSLAPLGERVDGAALLAIAVKFPKAKSGSSGGARTAMDFVESGEAGLGEVRLIDNRVLETPQS